jgi:hypothetical protein
MEPLANGLFPIVFALNQWLTRIVVMIWIFGRIKKDVIGPPRREMHPSATHPGNDFVIIDADFKYEVERDAGRFHRLGLRDCPGESIKKVTPPTVGLLQPVSDESDDDFVGHQGARIHDLLGSQAERRASGYGCTKHVSGRDLRDLEMFLDERRLRSFTRARRAKQNEFHRFSSSPL